MRPARIRLLFTFGSRTRADVRDDVRDEVAFHLEMRTADLMPEGLRPSEARTRALEGFRDVARSSARLATQNSTLERATESGRHSSRGCAPSPPG